MHIFIAPLFVPNTSANRHFYDKERYKKRNKNCQIPDLLDSANNYWSYHLKDAYSNALNITLNNLSEENKINYLQLYIANYIFARCNKDYLRENISFNSALTYYWNRLACQQDRVDLIINRIKLQTSKNFRPYIEKSLLHNNIVKTLVFHNNLLKKEKKSGLNLIQLLFNYITGEKKDIYGRILKRIVFNEIYDWQKHCKYKAHADSYSFRKNIKYVLYNELKPISIEKGKSKYSIGQIKKLVDYLDSKQMSKAYHHLLTFVQKGK